MSDELKPISKMISISKHASELLNEYCDVLKADIFGNSNGYTRDTKRRDVAIRNFIDYLSTLEADNAALLARAENAEADNAKLRDMIDKLINMGNKIVDDLNYNSESDEKMWHTLVAEWSESQNKPE